jgi:hypothetical protein
MAHRRVRRAFGRPSSLAQRACGKAVLFFWMSPGTLGRVSLVLGLTLISTLPLPPRHQGLLHRLNKVYRFVCGGGQHWNRPPTAHNMVCHYRLIGVHGNMLDRDLLLASSSMLVESLRQHGKRPRGLIGERQTSGTCPEMLCTIKPTETIQFHLRLLERQ